MVYLALSVLALACARVSAIDQLPLASQHAQESIRGRPVTYDDGSFEHVRVASLPDYQIRVRQVKNLCDPKVKQYSGYLDVSKEKHLFFWFFESRKDPKKAPLAAWMNGGPGGSSALGLLTENGPCGLISGNATTNNPYSWNEVTNIFYLDQPAGVGYSYSTSPHTVDTTWEAAKDFYAFVQLFLKRFPEYDDRPFHVLAESYGGQYAPNFANYINRRNKADHELVALSHSRINLESVVVVNGAVDMISQAETHPEYACAGPYAFWDNNGEHSGATMQELWNALDLDLGLSIYDVRKPCEEQLKCHAEMGWTQEYLNQTSIKLALGVPAALNYSMISWDINSAFIRSGDIANDATPMIRELLEDGVRVLNLAGDADFACNYMGNFKWMYELDSPYTAEFRSLNNTVWKRNGKAVGEVRAAGDQGGTTSGNFTWLRVYEAGHMVPRDQPEVALDFFTKWLNNEPIA